MAFLHPWALVMGAAAVGLPLLVHWLTRPRPVRVPLSTLRFVREAVHQRRTIHRLRDALILSLRVLAVLLLAGAFARPLVGGRGDPPPERSAGEGSAHVLSRVVVLDVSQSMGAVERGIAVFERARSAVAEHLEGETGMRADLILAGAQPQAVFGRLSANLADLRNELAGAGPRPELCDVEKALTIAAELLSAAPGDEGHRRELVVITDLQASNWKAADFSELPEDTIIELESAAAESTLANLAILRAGAAGRAELGRPVRLEVEVGNFSDTPRTVNADVMLGSASWRLEGVCPAGSTIVLTADATPAESGWQHGQARLVDVEDAIAADNMRAFVVEVRPPARYVLITREEAERRPSSSYYLERALAPELPREATQTGQRVLRVPPSRMDRDLLGSADLLVIDRPGPLRAEAVNWLAALVVRGKPMIYVASEAADATNLALLVQAGGADLRVPVEFTPPSALQRRRGLSLASYRRDLPPFSVFGMNVVEAIEPLRFTRGLDSRRLDRGLQDDVLAVYEDGTAALVWTEWRAGSLAVLNADLADSNLVQSAAFVPLLGELTGNLPARSLESHIRHCGEALTLWLPPEAGAAAGLEINGPAGSGGDLGELLEEPAGAVWRWTRVGAPGVYEVLRDGQPVLAMAAAAPSEESDLRSMSPLELAERLAGGRTVHFRSALTGGQNGDDWWTWIAVACAAFMLLEWVALRMFKT